MRALRPIQGRARSDILELALHYGTFTGSSGSVTTELAMSHDQTYDDERAARLMTLLKALAARIETLMAHDDLSAAGPELIRLMGDARSELFHYEVRSTYDSPEIAASRRVVEQAKRAADQLDLPDGDEFELRDSEEDLRWLE